LAPGGEKQQWPPITEIMTFRKSQLFIEFPYMWLSNLKFYEPRKLNVFTYNSHIPLIFAGSWTLLQGAASPLVSPTPACWCLFKATFGYANVFKTP
jgi:hypothetical protein